MLKWTQVKYSCLPFPLIISCIISWALALTWLESLRGTFGHKCRKFCWFVDDGDRRSVSRQDRRMEWIIVPSTRVITPQATAVHHPAQGWAGGGVQQRRYLQLPVSAHYVHFPLVSPPLIADFPEGLWSGQIEKFSCSFSVSRRQCYKADEFSVYYSFMTAPVCLWD